MTDLMIKRFMVVADYPDSKMDVGDILTFEEGKFRKYIIGYGYVAFAERYLKKFPHLFRELNWWEFRDEKDMPEFVKQFNTGIVEKVKGYGGCMSIVEFYDDTEGHISFWFPATLQEYNEYILKSKQ